MNGSKQAWPSAALGVRAAALAALLLTLPGPQPAAARPSFPTYSPAETYRDLRGNKLSDSLYDYTWDELNRLIAVQVGAAVPKAHRVRLVFEYDTFGRRAVKRVYRREEDDWALEDTVKFVYAGWLLIAELDAEDNLLRSYTWGRDLSGGLQAAGGIGGLMAVRDHAAGRTLWPVYDDRGNVTALVDAAEHTVLASIEYGPYGELLAVDAAPGAGIDRTNLAALCPLLFSTKYLDAELLPSGGLYYYGYRYYEPTAGKWLNRDPIAEAGGLNLYGFVGNDPFNAVDPWGLERFREHSYWGPHLQEVPTGPNASLKAFQSQYGDLGIPELLSLWDLGVTYFGQGGRYQSLFPEMSRHEWQEFQREDIKRLVVGGNSRLVAFMLSGHAGEEAHSRELPPEFREMMYERVRTVRDNRELWFATSVGELHFHPDHVVGLGVLEQGLRRIAQGGFLPKKAVPSKAARTRALVSPRFRIWNDFQAGTKGQFKSRAEAARAWNDYKKGSAAKTPTGSGTPTRASGPPTRAGTFPKDPPDLMPEIPRNAKGHIHPSQHIRIRPEQHPLPPGETFAPRHHGQHYYVEIRIDPSKSWNNPKNVIKVKPPGYTPG